MMEGIKICRDMPLWKQVASKGSQKREQEGMRCCETLKSVKGLKIRWYVWNNTLIPLIKDVEGGVEYTLNGSW